MIRIAHMYVYISFPAPVDLFLHQRSDFIHSRFKDLVELIPDEISQA